jgi:hypothetical protein
MPATEQMISAFEIHCTLVTQKFMLIPKIKNRPFASQGKKTGSIDILYGLMTKI